MSRTPSPGDDRPAIARVSLGRVRRAVTGLTTVVLTLAVLGLVGLVAAHLLGYRSLIVRSGSMGDTVPVGSLALTEQVPREEIEVGDVAVIDPRGATTPRLHRVIDVSQQGSDVLVSTQGDANPAPDSGRTVLEPSVTVPVAMVPLVGYVVGGAGSSTGLLVLGTAAAGIVAWWVLRALWRTPRAAVISELSAR